MRKLMVVLAAVLAVVLVAGCGDNSQPAGNGRGDRGGDSQSGDRRGGPGQGNRDGMRPEGPDGQRGPGGEAGGDTLTPEQRRAQWLEETRKNAQTVRVPVTAALPKAMAAQPGQLIGVRLERNDAGPVYSFEILGDTDVLAVKVSAVTGSVTGIEPASMRGGGRYRRPASAPADRGGQDEQSGRGGWDHGSQGGHSGGGYHND